MMETSSLGSAPTVSPTDLTLHQEVDIESRTWAGINKPGGHATIIKIHVDDNNVPNKVDVRYVLGGRELGVELTYVKMHVELARKGRSRRNDKKMNVEALGGGVVVEKKKKVKKQVGGAKKKKGSLSPVKKEGGKKRKALASIDGNHGKAKVAKKGKEEDIESSQNVVEPVERVEEVGEDGKWTLIQDGRITDYTDTLQKGQRIAYWWSDEDGWLKGNVSKALTKVVSASTIGWTVKVDFDNGDAHSLAFHPLEKRWKIFHSNKKAPSAEKATDEPKKKSAKTVRKPASKKSSKPVMGEKKDAKVTSEKKAKPAPKMGEKTKTEKSTKPKGIKQVQTPTLPFGSNLQSKIKEISTSEKKIKPAPKMGEKTKTAKPSTKPKGIKKVQTPTLSFGSNLQSKIKEISSKMHKSSSKGTSEPAGKKQPRQDMEESIRVMEEKRARAASSQVSLISSRTATTTSTNKCSNSEEAVQSQGFISKYAKSLKKASGNNGGSSETVLQSLYRKESEKAENFVDYMTGSSNTIDSKEKSAEPSSPGSDGDLELKLDHGRVQLFVSLLSEIMFKRRMDMMDVEEMIQKINTHHKSSKPFTHLEIKPYLQQLHDEGRVFIVEDEGKMGVVYAMT